MKTTVPGKRGRPRKFDRDQVLDCAVNTFLANGYEGASVGALTESMGINSPSLYSTFGNKQKLFMQAIDRYAATIGQRQIQAFDSQTDIKSAVAAFLEEVSTCVTSEHGPAGCLLANVATEVAERDTEIRDKIAGMAAGTEIRFADRLQSAQEEGKIPKHVDPNTLARMILVVARGLASMARGGAGRDEVSSLARDFTHALFRK